MHILLNNRTLAQDFWKYGYIHLPGFFDSDLMRLYNNKILSHFGMDPQYIHSDAFIEQSGTDVIPWFPQKDGETCFDAVNNHQDFVSLTQEILGDGWYEQYCMVMFSKKDTLGQAWHQDCVCDNPQHFNLNRLIYTMDISADTTGGQITLIPGSHLSGIIPSHSQAFDEDAAISLSPKKGDLVMMHGHCYHKVEKVIGEYRVSTNYRSAAAQTPENITDIAVYRNMIYEFSTSTALRYR